MPFFHPIQVCLKRVNIEFTKENSLGISSFERRLIAIGLIFILNFCGVLTHVFLLGTCLEMRANIKTKWYFSNIFL